MTITYRKGDATRPVGEGHKLILHICNDIGAWGSGFVVALSNRWPQPGAMYRKWYSDTPDFGLGQVQFVTVEDDITVVNMIAQRGVRKQDGTAPIRYSALEECLAEVYSTLTDEDTIHGPRFGAGLAGGDWSRIEKIIKTQLPDIPVTIYDL